MSTFGSILSDSIIFDNTVYHIEGTDNATTDAAALSAARTALLDAGGGTIIFDGTLNLSSVGLFLMGSSTIPLGLRGTGNTSALRFSGNASHYLHWGHLNYLFQVSDKWNGTVVPITTYGAYDDYKWRQFTTSDDHDIEAGDWIYVWSESTSDQLSSEVEAQASPTSHHPGELVRVKSVDGTLITLEHWVKDFMTTLWFRKRDMAVGPFRVGDFSVIVDAPVAGTRTLEFRSCVSGVVENIHYKGTCTSGIGFTGSANMTCRNCTFEGAEEADFGNSSVALAHTATTDCIVENIRSSGDYRHHFDTSAPSSEQFLMSYTGQSSGTFTAGSTLSWTASGGSTTTGTGVITSVLTDAGTSGTLLYYLASGSHPNGQTVTETANPNSGITASSGVPATYTRIGTIRGLVVRNWRANVSTQLVQTVTYIGGTGSLPSVGATITWNAGASHGRITELVSGNNVSGTMKIRQATNNGLSNSSDSGSHTGSNNAATLTDSGGGWTTNAFVGFRLVNKTDGSYGTITANDATTITATLTGGTDNDWDTGDLYEICSDVFTDGSWSAGVDTVTAPSAAAVLSTHEGGWGIIFDGCHVAFNTMFGAGYAAQGRARGTTFINCTFDCTNSSSYGIVIAAQYCKVINCTFRDAWIAVECTTSGIKNGDYCTIQNNHFEKCRNGVVLDSLSNKVVNNKFNPPVMQSSTGTYYAPITVRSSRTGQQIIGNYIERTPSTLGAGGNPPTDKDTAIWQASSGLVSKCMGNTFDGWGEATALEAPGDVYPFYTGAYGAIAQDDTFFNEWKDRNFFD